MNLTKISVASIAAVAAFSMAGCGTATNLSIAGNVGPTLTKATFASAVQTATGQYRSVHVDAVIAAEGREVTVTADVARSGDTAHDTVLSAAVSVLGLPVAKVRVVDGVLYLEQSGLATMGDHSSKPWLSAPLDDAHSPFGSILKRLSGSLRPDLLATTFRSASTVTKLGTTTIDDVATTHYRVSVDLGGARTMLGLPLVTRPGAAATIAYDVWIDGQSLPAMVSVQRPGFTVKLQFSHWGDPVRVTPPPASQVAPMPR